MKTFRYELINAGECRVVIGEDHYAQPVVTVPAVREALLIIRALYKAGLGYEVTPAGTLLHLPDGTVTVPDHAAAIGMLATAAYEYIHAHIIRATQKEV